MSKFFEITANGTLMGEYKGQDKANAIQSYLVEAGYESVEDCADALEITSEQVLAELSVSEIDVEKLVVAVEAAADATVFQDAYGDGIALVKNESYATHRELAGAFGLDIDNFHV